MGGAQPCDQFVNRYSYYDTLNRPQADAAERAKRATMCRNPHRLHELVPEPAERNLPGGISFPHDMGVYPHFMPPGESSYEISGLAGCFSYMTCEQLYNWICMAVTYVTGSGDWEWAKQNRAIFKECLSSLLNRDDPKPSKRNGLNGLDSDACAGGWEITTYDSLDHSLGQARNNGYMAVKGWAACLGLELVLGKLGELNCKWTPLTRPVAPAKPWYRVLITNWATFPPYSKAARFPRLFPPSKG